MSAARRCGAWSLHRALALLVLSPWLASLGAQRPTGSATIMVSAQVVSAPLPPVLQSVTAERDRTGMAALVVRPHAGGAALADPGLELSAQLDGPASGPVQLRIVGMRSIVLHAGRMPARLSPSPLPHTGRRGSILEPTAGSTVEPRPKLARAPGALPTLVITIGRTDY